MRKGDKVVVVLSGAGRESASIREVTKIFRGKVFVEGSNTPYDSKTLRADSFISGFSTRLIELEQ